MNTVDPADLDAAAANGESGIVEDGRCPTCERKGLPILPVRLAVCQRTFQNSDIPELPAERAAAFTDITLDKTLANGEEQSRELPEVVKEYIHEADAGKVNKYILRQLRPGYLYFLDLSNPEGFYWTSYVINEDGMYRFFSVRDTPPSTSEAVFDCKDKEEGEKKPKALNASVVTLTHIESMTDLYYAYTEHPWSSEHRQMIQDNADWREANMQKINIPAWIDGRPQPEDKNYGFTIDELDQVAEFSDGADAVKEHFWPDNSERQLFTREELRDVMATRLSAAPEGMKDKGLVLGVKDEMGIINELNAYRQRPQELMEKFLAEEEEMEIEGEQKVVSNLRKLLSLLAIDSFASEFELAKNHEQHQLLKRIDENPAPRVRAARERIVEIDEEISELRESSGDGWFDGWLNDKKIETLEIERRDRQNIINNNEAVREQIAEGSSDRIEDLVREYRDQLEDCYDEGMLSDFSGLYYAVQEKVYKISRASDEDYCQWLKNHVEDVVDRYECDNFNTGLGLSGIIANGFRGGVQSPASAGLWLEYARDIDGPHSFLRRVVFAFNGDFLDSSLQEKSALRPKKFFSPDTLEEWKGKYGGLLESGIDESYGVIISTAVANINDALSGLAVNEVKFKEEAAGSIDALRSFLCYQQLAFVGQKHVQESKGLDNLPLLGTLTVKRRDYHSWIDEISRKMGEGRHPEEPSTTALKYFDTDGVGGNFSATYVDGSISIEAVVPLDGSNPDVLGFFESDVDFFDAEDGGNRTWDMVLGAADVSSKIIGASLATPSSAGGYSSPSQLQIARTNISRTMVITSAIAVLTKELMSDDPDAWKMTGAIVNLVTTGVDIGIGFRTAQLAATAGTAGADAAIAASRMVSGLNFAKVGLGAISGAMSFVDGVKKIGEASRATRIGMPSTIVEQRSILGGVQIVGAAVSLIGLAIAGPVITIGGILIGIISVVLGYRFLELVRPAAAGWVDRSLFGVHESQISAFQEMNQELRSLDMVFKGVTVEFTWESGLVSNPVNEMHALGADREAIEAYINDAGKNIKLKVSIPKFDDLNGSFTLVSPSSGEELMNYEYRKLGGEELPVLRKGAEREVIGALSNDVDIPDFEKKGGFYEVEVKDNYSNHILGDRVLLEVVVRSHSGNIATVSDNFVMEF